MDSFIKLYRSDITNELLKDASAFMLLTQIALRARRTDVFNVENLNPGEALIGDYKNIGLSRQNYRSALKRLEKWKIITTKATNRGTVATICNSDIYDINILKANRQTNCLITVGQPASNQQPAINNNDKNRKNDKNVNYEQIKKYRKSFKTNKERFKFEKKPDYSQGL